MFCSLASVCTLRIFLLWSFSLWMLFAVLDLNSQFSRREVYQQELRLPWAEAFLNFVSEVERK